MKGKHTLRVMTKKVSFTLELKRKYTILRGDSGTGKSTFANYIEQYNRYGNSSGVDVDCDVDVVRLLRDEDFNLENKIIVIDEGDSVLRRGDVTKLFEKSSCYFVVITRKAMGYLPYSYEEVYEFSSKELSRKYTEVTLSNVYKDSSVSVLPDLVLLEDDGSGYNFYKRFLRVDNDSCKGKDNIVNKLEKYYSTYKTIMIICDGAGIGCSLDLILKSAELHSSTNNVYIVLPESFEYLLLNAMFENSHDIMTIVNKPYDYCDSGMYQSWETFFTDILIKAGVRYKKPYSKRTMCSYYYSKPEKVFSILSDLSSDAWSTAAMEV